MTSASPTCSTTRSSRPTSHLQSQKRSEAPTDRTLCLFADFSASRQVHIPLRRGPVADVDLLRAVTLRAQRPPPLGARQTSVLGVRLHVCQREAAQVAPHRVLHLRGSPQYTHRRPGSAPPHGHGPSGRVQERKGTLAELGRVDVRDPLATVDAITRKLGVASVFTHADLPKS